MYRKADLLKSLKLEAKIIKHLASVITPAQLEEWRTASQPLHASWAAKTRKVGLDPDVVMKELKTSLEQYKAAY